MNIDNFNGMIMVTNNKTDIKKIKRADRDHVEDSIYCNYHQMNIKTHFVHDTPDNVY